MLKSVVGKKNRKNIFYLIIFVLLLILLVIGYFLPIWKIKQIRVSGNEHLSDKEVLAVVKIPDGLTFSQVNKKQLGKEVLTLPWVKEVTVSRKFPDTIKIKIKEHKPVAVYNTAAGKFLVDDMGIDFAKYEKGNFPEIQLPNGVDNNPNITKLSDKERMKLAIATINQIKANGIIWLKNIRVDIFGYIEVEHVNGAVSRWGFGDDLLEKAKALKIVMSQPGKVYNVSNYALPTIK